MVSNPTQGTGIAVFGLAALACAWAAGRLPKPWWIVAAAQLAFALEVLFGMRHQVHEVATRLLRLHGWYPQRAGWQIVLLAAGALVAGIAGAALAWRRPVDHSFAAALAVASTLATAVLFGIEIVSLHATDTWLYASVGPILRIAWIWAGLACVVAGAAAAAASA